MPILYEPTLEPRHYAKRFGIKARPPASPVRPGDQGLFIRRPRGERAEGSTIQRFQITSGRWGLIPLFSREREVPNTAEARVESAANERNFHQPWKRGHRCVVLADALMRHGDDARSAVRVTRTDGAPLMIAGLWNGWRSPEGECVESFALLTLPSDEHPLQRKVVFLPDAWVDDWLHCPVEETAAYLRVSGIDKIHRERITLDPDAAGQPSATNPTASAA